MPSDTPVPPARVTVIGIGADGWDGLGPAARDAITAAPLVIGGHRHQTMLPDIPGQDRRRWPTPMLPSLSALLDEYAGREIVVVASGDPMVSGVGSTLVARLGAENVTVVPAVSSVALARAAMGWPAESVDVVTVVGRDPAAVLARVGPGRRLIVLSADENTPSQVASLLVGAGYGASGMTVLGELGGPAESRIEGTARAWAAVSPRLNLICLSLVSDPGTVLLAGVPGLPDEAFEHDGQLTKRDVRASAMARLAPVPGQLLWDVGAGAGSVAVEWARTDPRCAAIAIERDAGRAERIGRNASSLGVPGVRVVVGGAPDALHGLPEPDAVFVGGGATTPGVLDTCWAALRPGGRLVVHAVTLETEAALFERYKALGGELVRLSVERAAPVGTFTGWTPSRAVTQWSITRASEGPA
ncbi:precorrin-6Y C5,15-methyltransferase (decarboxylating) [Nakamurella panacisegetis]|uniref:Precorrin-6Y C5,15-methyltransferase (Decarboxylating) n=1 Tax=Nakamurella panacisegetis TaxID=1090615 RepID=A0A1H0HZH6_9ACTN|nr:precorrin-6y C5,15-methyltransferase (decarboxylating) subunit CbiE [Nakamurella panacisegetis]SDO24554.1 precorrin-6Y C5,15-methyltransferase (decarboxylating) [Nakamurella panacisegetis]